MSSDMQHDLTVARQHVDERDLLLDFLEDNVPGAREAMATYESSVIDPSLDHYEHQYHFPESESNYATDVDLC